MIFLAPLALQKTTVNPANAVFFPIQVGATYEYTDSSAPGSIIKDVVQPLHGEDALSPENSGAHSPNERVLGYFPIIRTLDGQQIASPGYRIDGNQVTVAASAIDSPITPRILLYSINAERTWSYDENMVTAVNNVPIHVACDQKPLGMKSWLGVSRLTLEVTTHLTGKSGKQILDITQVADYADGVGMVYYKESGQIGSHKILHTMELTSYKGGKTTQG